MKIILTVLVFLVSVNGFAQNQLSTTEDNQTINSEESELESAKLQKAFLEALSKLSIKAYGVVNYYNFDWELDPDRRNAVDIERINLYMKYAFTDKIILKTEFEIEHGGTGVTMELDKLEEFGEFEVEIEAGGEVLLEQLNVQFLITPWFNVRVGRFRMYVGVASKNDLPVNYFTGYRQEMENAILPLGWYETGIEISGDLGEKKKWSYIAYLVNGLTSTGFTSANWIKRGHQKRFEMANAENMAVAGRFDYNLANNGFIGVGGYHGGSNQNRPKPDLQNTPGNVSLFDVHANINKKNWKIRAMFLYGNLQNSERISQANRNLSNALNVKRTPVAKNAMGYYVEAGYNVLALTKKATDQQLFLFGRYDFYDSMFKTEGVIIDNPRWERKVITFGLNYFPHPGVVLKSHYALRTLGIPSENKENTFLLGLAFTFKTTNY